MPPNKVTVRVEDGWLTLEGELNRPIQRDAAKRAVEHRWRVRGDAPALYATGKPNIGAGQLRGLGDEFEGAQPLAVVENVGDDH